MPKVSNCKIYVLEGARKDQSQEFWSHPESIRWEKSANYADTEIMMRSEPVPVYSSSSARTLTVDLDFVSDSNSDKDDVHKVIAFLESLVYPDNTSASSIPTAPPKCLFILGSVVNMIVVVTSVSPELKAPFDPDTMKYHNATVSVGLREVSSRNRYSLDSDTNLKVSYANSPDLLMSQSTQIA